MDWSNWQQHDRALAKRRIKWLTVETRAQALDAAMAGAGVALMDMAYIATPVAEGRLSSWRNVRCRCRPAIISCTLPNARNLHLLSYLRDWAVEAARPFRVA